MLVSTVKNQLGNQMFAYAVVKTIAQYNGYDFRYILELPKESETAVTNTKDRKYGLTIETIFNLDPDEKVASLDSVSNLSTFNEWQCILNHGHSFYLSELFKIEDNTLLDGHFISARYLKDNLSNVRKWFTFPNDIQTSVNDRIDKIKSDHPESVLIGVHFRCGKDYFRYGYMMDYSYWHNAAMKMKSVYQNVHFILFYDVKGKYVQRFANEFDCSFIHGSLVEDIYGLSQCDGLIICNSSFSLMSAILNSKANHICCPEHYYSGADVEQYDCFMESWDTISCRRNLKSLWFARLRLYKIRHLMNRLKGM